MTVEKWTEKIGAFSRPKKVDLDDTDEEDVNERGQDKHEKDFDVD